MIDENVELLKTLAKEHQVPEELAQAMAVLMGKYTDTSPWGSKADLRSDLEKVIEAALKHNLVITE
ncbi:MAG: hypothetical protein EPN21_05470 [Methylococcaceae bacterium]|nr:MAG: hypothetical protein EPN21_05470 [Methylococcaceae bacterium]